jgi:hypothetical protein
MRRKKTIEVALDTSESPRLQLGAMSPGQLRFGANLDWGRVRRRPAEPTPGVTVGVELRLP